MNQSCGGRSTIVLGLNVNLCKSHILWFPGICPDWISMYLRFSSYAENGIPQLRSESLPLHSPADSDDCRFPEEVPLLPVPGAQRLAHTHHQIKTKKGCSLHFISLQRPMSLRRMGVLGHTGGQRIQYNGKFGPHNLKVHGCFYIKAWLDPEEQISAGENLLSSVPCVLWLLHLAPFSDLSSLTIATWPQTVSSTVRERAPLFQ